MSLETLDFTMNYNNFDLFLGSGFDTQTYPYKEYWLWDKFRVHYTLSETHNIVSMSLLCGPCFQGSNLPFSDFYSPLRPENHADSAPDW